MRGLHKEMKTQRDGSVLLYGMSDEEEADMEACDRLRSMR